MDTKKIIRESGKLKARVDIDKYGAQLMTMRNGFQWSGAEITPVLAELTIEVLREYLDICKSTNVD